MNPFPESLRKSPSEEDSDFSDSDELFAVHNEGKKKIFVCQVPECGKTFRYKSEIFRHVATHSNQRPHACPFEGCKKSFKRGDALENHIRTHTKDTPFSCEFEDCGLSFTTKASLRYHVLKHKDQKIFQCNFPGERMIMFSLMNNILNIGCQKAFITVFQLRQHEKSNCVHKRLKGPAAETVNDEENKDPNPVVKKPKREVKSEKSVKVEIPIASPFLKNVPSIPSVWNPKEEIENSVNGSVDVLEDRVKEILSENRILKKRLELSQKIIGLLQHQIQYEPLNIPEYPPPEMMTENLLRYQFYNNNIEN